MSKLLNFCWLETDDFCNSTGRNIEKLKKGILSIVFLIASIHHWKLLLQIYQDWKFSVKNQRGCIQLCILTCLSRIVKVLI